MDHTARDAVAKREHTESFFEENQRHLDPRNLADSYHVDVCCVVRAGWVCEQQEAGKGRLTPVAIDYVRTR
jgi:hypothetical protein